MNANEKKQAAEKTPRLTKKEAAILRTLCEELDWRKEALESCQGWLEVKPNSQRPRPLPTECVEADRYRQVAGLATRVAMTIAKQTCQIRIDENGHHAIDIY